MEQQNQQQQNQPNPDDLQPPKKSLIISKRPYIAVGIAAILLAIAGILLLKTTQPKPFLAPVNNVETLEGIVRFEPLEGGCWYLQVPADPGPLEDIAKYELLGVSENALEQYRDQQVKVKGQTREDMVSICQIGTIFEVQEISTIDGSRNDTFSEVDTSTWQTYRSEEFGFEVEHPNGWVVETSTPTLVRITYTDEIGIKFAFDVNKQGSRSLAFEEWVIDWKANIENGSFHPEVVETTVSGLKAYKMADPVPVPGVVFEIAAANQLDI